ncbi:MAG: 16S rRNA (guanine(527)-N(7))-methyltransferase RsmG [Candidatus Sumerlaeaceae bacterium]|nr:16S rRNA (guanine(527)-N(7))-methyltransferase RsmG [Candidatus Sumerlaeaceae bacterium]
MTSMIATYLSALPTVARHGEVFMAQFARLVELLLEANQQVNLTAITDPAAVAIQHIADSLTALDAEPALGTAGRAADIGSGAGFPLLPLAIVTPAIHWTAIESIAKKCRFIESTARALGLGNVETHSLRAEDAGRSELRETFDLATARAVGPISSLCEVGLPLLKIGGILLLYKTHRAEPELAAASTAIERLGGTMEPSHSYSLPGDAQKRAIFRIRKSSPTPKTYPRRAGVPFKKPLL